MTFDGSAARPATDLYARQEPRKAVNMMGSLRRRGGRAAQVQILDLSTKGFRIETHLIFSPGVEVWFQIPTLRPIPARVAWTKCETVGFVFDEPLHPAVLEKIAGGRGR